MRPSLGERRLERFSDDELRGGRVFNGFDYEIQVWVVDGVIQPCGPPASMRHGGMLCCDAFRFAGQRIADVPGAEELAEPQDWMLSRATRDYLGTAGTLIAERSSLVFTSKLWATPHVARERGETEPSARIQPISRLAQAIEALWLARPSALGTSLALTMQKVGAVWEPRGLYWKQPPLIPAERDADVVLTEEDFARGRDLNLALAATRTESSAWVAASVLWRALHELNYEGRYLLLWVGLEALFTPKDAQGEVTHQLAERLALFLHGRGADARTAYARAKRCYSIRSTIAHGRQLRWTDDSLPALDDSERMLRDSLVRVLDDTTLSDIFANDSRRDEYLKHLAFSP